MQLCCRCHAGRCIGRHLDAYVRLSVSASVNVGLGVGGILCCSTCALIESARGRSRDRAQPGTDNGSANQQPAHRQRFQQTCSLYLNVQRATMALLESAILYTSLYIIEFAYSTVVFSITVLAFHLKNFRILTALTTL